MLFITPLIQNLFQRTFAIYELTLIIPLTPTPDRLIKTFFSLTAEEKMEADRCQDGDIGA